MLLPLVLTGLAALVASGVLFQHKRWLTFLAVAGIAFEAQWLLLTLLEQRWVLIGSVILLAGWLSCYRGWQLQLRGTGWRDTVVLLVTGVVLLGAWSVLRVNGFDGLKWVTHGFYNGDVATFAALTQRALATGQLVQENPFAGNGSLEYPSLLHTGVARFFTALGIGGNWLYFLPVLVYIQIFLTIPLFFLFWDSAVPDLGLPSRWMDGALSAGAVLFIMALSWEAYIYPQSHFFLMGLELLLIALLAQARRGWRYYLQVAVAMGVVVVLLLANAVMGSVAAVLLGIFAWLRLADPARWASERAAYGGLLVAVIALFSDKVGDAALGRPGFSYTAALDMLRLAPFTLALVAGFFMARERLSFLQLASVAVAALGFVIYLFSTRDIIVANAARFFYHSLLIGWPLLIPLAVQMGYWLRRQLWYVSRSVTGQLLAYLAVLVAGLLLLLPAGASVASAHDNLWFKDRQEINLTMRSALWWVEDNTPAAAVFIASPQEPFAIPLLTGRALLRTDYWLSPDDMVLADIEAAFVGDVAAREKILPQADYLLLTNGERASWEPLPYEKVYDYGDVVIYKLR